MYTNMLLKLSSDARRYKAKFQINNTLNFQRHVVPLVIFFKSFSAAGTI